jgi:hypothetical protein
MTTSSSKYAYPANLNVANFVSLKLTSTNFLLWETQVLSLIESQDLIGFITGSTSAPKAEISNPTNDGTMPNPDLAAWTRTDRLVKEWITATISEEALGTVVGLTTSLDVWKALSNAYSEDSQVREFELLLKLQEKKKDSITLTDFIRNFKLTCDQLNAIGKSMPDQKKVFWLLNGLGPRYESFSTAMLKPPVPSYNDLIPLLHSHELRNQSLLADQVNPAMAFVGQRSNSNNKGSQSSFNSRGKGFHQAGSRPPSTPRNFQQHAPSKNSNHSSISTSSSSIPQCQICKKKGHHALKCWHRFDHSYQDDQVPQALTALHVNSPNEGEWLPDTGVTAHITDDPGILSDIKPYVGSDSVMVGNGHQLPITHTGNAHIFPTDSPLSLNNVLIVLDIKNKLLSVSQLTCDYPCYFLFDNHGFVIKDLQTHQVLASGSKEDSLYVLQHAPVKVFFSNRFRVADSNTWHGRLGHPQPRILQFLNHNKFISVNKKSSSFVQSCALSKSCKLPFFPSANKAIIPLAKIHCDLWGPTPVLSNQDFRYYAIFVDDFSRFTWLYPLKKKSDFYRVFFTFQAMVEKQFQHEIKVFHSDSGGEFTKQEFIDHLLHSGIVHLLSCPGTPE